MTLENRNDSSVFFCHASDANWKQIILNHEQSAARSSLAIHVKSTLFAEYFFFSSDGSITTASLYDVRFEDVYRNGADGGVDESLTFLLNSNARLAAGRETFVKTATVVATVYVDGNSVIRFLCSCLQHPIPLRMDRIKKFSLFLICNWQDEDGDDCNSIECHGDDDIDDNSLVFDKRFWLITRVGGALTDDEMPNFRHRLAELYRKAFNR